MPRRNPRALTEKDIQRAVFKRLKPYDKLNFLEQFAMFMGKAQLFELALKQLLARRYDYEFDDMERWTLGRTARELKKCGLRKDFVALLESLVKRRNFIAHELLASKAVFTALTGTTARFVTRPLEHGIYELEQIMFLHDWCEKYNAWA
jgi:hypothetical protein